MKRCNKMLIIKAFGIIVLLPILSFAQSVISTIPVANSPYDIEINQTTNRIYVGNTNRVTVIDGNTNTSIQDIVGLNLTIGVGVNPITNRVYAASSDGNLYVIDGATNNILNVIFIGFPGYTPHDVDVNPTTNRIYLVERATNRVFVIDGNTNQVITSISVAFQPRNLAINPITNKIYVAHNSGSRVTVINGATNSVEAVVPVVGFPDGIDVDTSTNKIYIGNNVVGKLAVLDGNTNTIIATITVNNDPTSHLVAVNSQNHRIYVTNGGLGTVIIDGLTNSIVASVPVSSGWGIAANSVTNSIYVSGNREVFVVYDPWTLNTSPTMSANTLNQAQGSYSPSLQIADVADNEDAEETLSITINGNSSATINGVTVSGIQVTSDGEVYANVSSDCSATDATFTLEVTDSGGLTTVGTLTVNVTANPTPTVLITSPPSGAVYPIGSTVNFAGGFADNDGDIHSAQWSFSSIGNSFSQPGTVDEVNKTVGTSYTFNSPGVYLISLSVADECGNTATATTVNNDLQAMIVVYDPNGGFVTGGGWIDSPVGAYRANLALTGKASFGFVSKYHNGATVPTGNTEFQFRAGNFNFRSTSYDWLVIAGARAQYKGTGTINGSGDYGFMLTAIDGQRNGGGGIDKFRIKIWDKSNGGIVYDNQVGGDTGDNATPSTGIGGGSIVIHKP